MDAFFAAVEQRDDPSLRGKPVLVGGPSRRGVVAAASYEARPFGVRSAMPMAEALRRCPDAIVVPPHRTAYSDASAQIFAIFERFTPLVEGLSIDEAFLDVTSSRSLFGDGLAIAKRIKEAVRAETGLIASAGVAPCKFIAKIASDIGKPDGLVVVRPDDVQSFLAPLPIERMWGVGPRAAIALHDSGFHTLGDLARASEADLERLLGSWGAHVSKLARGIDDRAVEPGWLAKSVGAEETFERDLIDRADLARELLAQARRVASRLQKSGLAGRTVVVKLKYSDFTLRSRRARVPEPVADTDSIYDAAKALLEKFPLRGRRVRLTGVAVADLVQGAPAPVLFPDPVLTRRRKLEAATVALTDRFGGAALTRGDLLGMEEERDPDSRAPTRRRGVP